jgi:hypothetical protein
MHDHAEQRVRKVVILGGGTAGWMAAALIARVLGGRVAVELVESEEIGIVGVGEATIPPIRTLNAVLGIDEAEFLRETRATIKLAIRFENWREEGSAYYHTFGTAGRNTAFAAFHHFWTRARKLGLPGSYWDFDLNYLCAQSWQVCPTEGNDPIWDLPYAFHFDAALYGRFCGAMPSSGASSAPKAWWPMSSAWPGWAMCRRSCCAMGGGARRPVHRLFGQSRRVDPAASWHGI